MSNKVGIYYAFWEKDWNADYASYVYKAKKLGFDNLEIAAGGLMDKSDAELKNIENTAKAEGIDLSYCIGVPAQYNVASEDESVRQAGIKFLTELLGKIAFMGGDMLGGITYACWPGTLADYDAKLRAREKSLLSMKELSKVAKDLGITFCFEVVNRFEQGILNTSAEGVQYIEDLRSMCNSGDACKLLLDTFHMNIEEDTFAGAIHTAGDKGLIGHFHIGEPNRKTPGTGRMPWDEIFGALKEVGYEGRILMEPFIRIGGEVGRDIKMYHDLSNNADEAKMDELAAAACRFVKSKVQ